jgi:hypothetical protein
MASNANLARAPGIARNLTEFGTPMNLEERIATGLDLAEIRGLIQGLTDAIVACERARRGWLVTDGRCDQVFDDVIGVLKGLIPSKP